MSVPAADRPHRSLPPHLAAAGGHVSGGTLYQVKPRFVAALGGVTDRLVSAKVDPITLTKSALPLQLAVAASLALGAFWPLAWLAVPPLAFLLLSVNALDGAVARRSNRSTRRGAILNELIDRAGDAAILLAGFAVAPPIVVVAGLVAVAASEIIALIGWATTGERSFPGVMGKPDRAAVVAGGAALAVAWAPALPIAYGAVAIGAACGAAVRARSVLNVGRRIDSEVTDAH